MLVLRRRVGERIVIADKIVFSILAINGQRVKIGIEAPLDIPISREELLPQQHRGSSDPQREEQR